MAYQVQYGEMPVGKTMICRPIFDECADDASLNKIVRRMDDLSKYTKEESKAIRSLYRRR
jgi:hypothetical protein